LTLQFNDGRTTREIKFNPDAEQFGTHDFSFNSEFPTHPLIASAPSIPNGTYTVTLSYRDWMGNPAASDTTTGVRIGGATPFAQQNATYTALIANPYDGNHVGQIRIRTSATGRLTGSVAINGQRTSFSGTIRDDGRSEVDAVRQKAFQPGPEVLGRHDFAHQRGFHQRGREEIIERRFIGERRVAIGAVPARGGCADLVFERLMLRGARRSQRPRFGCSDIRRASARAFFCRSRSCFSSSFAGTARPFSEIRRSQRSSPGRPG
jgi:hypothetical protein